MLALVSLSTFLIVAILNERPTGLAVSAPASNAAAVTTPAAPSSTVALVALPAEERLFSQDSPWNQLIPTSATYSGPDANSNGVLDDFDPVISGTKPTRYGALTSQQFGLPIAVVDPKQASHRIVVDCRVPGHVESVNEMDFNIVIPPSYVNEGGYGPRKTFGSGPDSALIVMDLKRRMGYDFFQLNPEPDSSGALIQEGLGTLCEKGGYTTYSLDGPGFGWKSPDDKNADQNGYIRAGIRAAGSSMGGGIVTRSEVSRALAGDTTAFPHALAVCLHADQLKKGWIFPAVSEDGYADNYRGSLPMGTRLAIDPSITMPAEVDTLMGKALWVALVRYGAYVVDQCGVGPTLGISIDATVVEPDLNQGVAMYEDGDLLQIAAALRVTDQPVPFAIPPASSTPPESTP
jgi:hypothetical protein